MAKISALRDILKNDKRYSIEAYSFVISALSFTTKKLQRDGHVSGEELLIGIKKYALEMFGPMAKAVLEYWGIKATNDFGEIVFNMIEAGALGKTGYDSIQDFNNKFDFKEVFEASYKYILS